MKVLLMFLLTGLFAFVSLSADGKVPFALYLVTKDARMKEPLESIPVESEPLFTDSDMLFYDAHTDTFRLVGAAAARLRKLKIATDGVWFVVFVNGKRYFSGAFWSCFSSMSCNSPTIMANDINMSILSFHGGYPANFSNAEPPFRKTLMRDALKKAGKLEDSPILSVGIQLLQKVQSLPHVVNIEDVRSSISSSDKDEVFSLTWENGNSYFEIAVSEKDVKWDMLPGSRVKRGEFWGLLPDRPVKIAMLYNFSNEALDTVLASEITSNKFTIEINDFAAGGSKPDAVSVKIDGKPFVKSLGGKNTYPTLLSSWAEHTISVSGDGIEFKQRFVVKNTSKKGTLELNRGKDGASASFVVSE